MHALPACISTLYCRGTGYHTSLHTATAWCGAGHDAQAVATAVATGLVAAYADLRQLQFLLQSLLDALLAQVPPTAAAVLCVPPFVQVLQKVSLCIQIVAKGREQAMPGWCAYNSGLCAGTCSGVQWMIA